MSAELVAACSRHTDDVIYGFFGPYRWLSNFHVCNVLYEGMFFTSSEAAYQAAKFDYAKRPAFVGLDPAGAKQLGGRLRMDNPSRWEQDRVSVMYEILTDKFTRNLDLRDALIATGQRHLQETNWWNDRFWGVCNGVGQNTLGRLLMELRKTMQH